MSDRYHSVVMVAGDSGDGIQLLGSQLTYAHARYGHVVQTLADFPAEIRAPAGTTHGVSGFRIAFSNQKLGCVPETINYVVVFNPAAWRVVEPLCGPQTVIIFDKDKWSEKDWRKAGYTEDPWHAEKRQRFALPLTQLTVSTCSDFPALQAKKNRNLLVLGLMIALHDLDLQCAVDAIFYKFSKNAQLQKAQIACLKAGYYLYETLEWAEHVTLRIPAAVRPIGQYTTITGYQALILGMLYASEKYQRKIILSGYPITPASELLHLAGQWSDTGIEVVQAEDEIAAAGIALGASYAGALGITCTSGPGLDLKAEMIGLALMAELPMVIIDVQRAGPSTGMPTKSEQSDLLSALYGRHGNHRVPVLAQRSSEEGIAIIEKAFDWAISAMTPVIVLTDAFLVQGASSIILPQAPVFIVKEDLSLCSHPFQRKKNEARFWIEPGTEKLAHCNGGLEKDYTTGEISYHSANHEHMVTVRSRKIDHLASVLPLSLLEKTNRDFLWIAYGSCCGALDLFFQNHLDESHQCLHLQEIDPLPSNFWDICDQYRYVCVVELADQQLFRYLKSLTNHPGLLSYSQYDASALNSERLKDWLILKKQEIGL